MTDIVRCPHSRYDTVLINNYPMCKGCVEYILSQWLLSGELTAAQYVYVMAALDDFRLAKAAAVVAGTLSISTRLDDAMRVYAKSLSSVHT